jgi:hypothetical protein
MRATAFEPIEGSHVRSEFIRPKGQVPGELRRVLRVSAESWEALTVVRIVLKLRSPLDLNYLKLGHSQQADQRR